MATENSTLVVYQGSEIDITAARVLMDDDICEQIHGSVETNQEFMNVYAEAHMEKYGTGFVFA